MANADGTTGFRSGSRSAASWTHACPNYRQGLQLQPSAALDSNPFPKPKFFQNQLNFELLTLALLSRNTLDSKATSFTPIGSEYQTRKGRRSLCRMRVQSRRAPQIPRSFDARLRRARQAALEEAPPEARQRPSAGFLQCGRPVMIDVACG